MGFGKAVTKRFRSHAGEEFVRVEGVGQQAPRRLQRLDDQIVHVVGVGQQLDRLAGEESADVGSQGPDHQPLRAKHSSNRRLLPPEHLNLGQNLRFGGQRIIGQSIAEVERKLILGTLNLTKGNKTEAARILGVTARTLSNKLRLYREKGLLPAEPAVAR